MVKPKSLVAAVLGHLYLGFSTRAFGTVACLANLVAVFSVENIYSLCMCMLALFFVHKDKDEDHVSFLFWGSSAGHHRPLAAGPADIGVREQK